MLQELTTTGLHSWLLPRVLGLQGISAHSRILDLGCGSGAWLTRLNQSGFRNLTGIDRQDKCFEKRDIATFLALDLDHLGVTALGTFDLVTAIEIVEHVANPEALIALAATNLARGGWLVITTPNVYALRWRARFLATAKLDNFDVPINPEHIHPWLVHANSRVILPRYGFEVVELVSYPETGGVATRWFGRIIEKALSLVFPNELPGDTLCLFLKKH